MKLASFFLLSTALHALALASPIEVLEPRVRRFIPVTLLSHGDGGDDLPKANPSKGVKKGYARQQSAGKTNVSQQPSVEPPKPTEQANRLVPVEASRAAEEPGVIALPANSNPSGGSGPAAGNGSQHEGIAEGATGSGNSGTGRGIGDGRDLSGAGAPLVQASYGYAPKPEYPHSARSEGKEGRVLLRVLVDAEGKTKTVQVNLSSGNDALDRAAMDTVRRWRFAPARYGDHPIESWVRIPIDFRLTDARE
jgi:periplasmic protein TonB